MPNTLIGDLLQWFGLRGEQTPEEPVYFDEATPVVSRPRRAARLTASLPESYLQWLHQPVEWFEEWRRRMQVAARAPVQPFDFDADLMDVVELLG